MQSFPITLARKLCKCDTSKYFKLPFEKSQCVQIRNGNCDINARNAKKILPGAI